MPVHLPVELKPLSDAEFRDLDCQVMGVVFALHRELGRFHSEQVYKDAAAQVLREDGVGGIERELPVTVSHRSFSKTYFLDLVVRHGVVYEFKTGDAITPDHERQALNYILLCELPNGKIFNLRPASVKHRFINSSLALAQRRRFEFITGRWQEAGDADGAFREVLHELLTDWGTFLELGLYEAALIHLLGGADKVCAPVRVMYRGREFARVTMPMLGPGTAFKLTAMTSGLQSCESHLCRWLAASGLDSLQWVNFNHHRVEFVTLKE